MIENLLTTHLSLLDLSEGLSLYIHIPFCQQRCYYCDFFTVQGWPRLSQDHIIQTIIDQTHHSLSVLAPFTLKTVYIGGGTPSLLSIDQLTALLLPLQAYHPTEITIEANPESLSAEWLDTFWHYGGTRLSLGVQSFDLQSLAKVGRIVQSQSLTNSLSWLKPHAHAVNIDLIAGLPRYNHQQMQYDLERIFDFDPGHISFYCLTIEDGTTLARRPQLVSHEDQRKDWWLAGRDILLQQGYEHYEISNYCKNGQYSLYNTRVWHMSNYLGIGPGAMSTLRLKNQHALRIAGVKDLKLWRDTPTSSQLYTHQIVSPSDFLFEHFMMGWRTQFGVDLTRLAHYFGQASIDHLQPFFDQYANIWQWVDHSIVLAPDERLFLDQHLVKLLQYIEKRPMPTTTVS
jgi:oxygen-independent coproporphyrinogen-3 oxidase